MSSLRWRASVHGDADSLRLLRMVGATVSANLEVESQVYGFLCDLVSDVIDGEPAGHEFMQRKTRVLLALPEVAELRAKAAAADRVRELLERADRRASRDVNTNALRHALDGPSTAAGGTG